MVIVVMGVAGTGKTTVGRAIAAQLGAPFLDGDDRHPHANVEKMRAGIPLTDADREPWLASLHAAVAHAIARRESLIVACSALKRRYRTALRGDCRGVRFVYLKAADAELTRRLTNRRDHFAGPELLASQREALEEPDADEALAIDATWPPDKIIAFIRREFGL